MASAQRGNNGSLQANHVSAVNPIMHIAEEKRSKTNPMLLDFKAAMSDFRTMFPDLEDDLIERVLRANHGNVDHTVDRLLKMTLNKEIDSFTKTPGTLTTLPEVDELNQDKSREDNPPALPPREGSLKRKKPIEKRAPVLYNTPTTLYDTDWNGMKIPLLGKLPADFLRIVHEEPPPRPPKTIQSKTRSMSLKTSHAGRHNLERLDIKPASVVRQHSSPATNVHKDIHGRLTTPEGERMSTNAIKRQLEANQRRIMETCDTSELDNDASRYLEDERLALIMQNEEFLRELKHNEDFMRTLEFERDILANKLAHSQRRNHQLRTRVDSGTHHWMEPRPSERDDNSVLGSLSPDSEGPFSPISANTPTAAQVPTDKTDDHDFKDQLKSMGASSKKKFAVLAKKFFSTARRRRKSNKTALRSAFTPSTQNLLDDNDDEDLIDISNSCAFDRDVNVMFEPLPDNWTSGEDETRVQPNRFGDSL